MAYLIQPWEWDYDEDLKEATYWDENLSMRVTLKFTKDYTVPVMEFLGESLTDAGDIFYYCDLTEKEWAARACPNQRSIDWYVDVYKGGFLEDIEVPQWFIEYCEECQEEDWRKFDEEEME